jgi:hypothetical protein
MFNYALNSNNLQRKIDKVLQFQNNQMNIITNFLVLIKLNV